MPDATESISPAQTVTLAIGGMSCGHCVAAVSSALEAVPGVRVQGVTIGAATLVLDPAAGPPRALAESAVEAVADAGYEASVSERMP